MYELFRKLLISYRQSIMVQTLLGIGLLQQCENEIKLKTKKQSLKKRSQIYLTGAVSSHSQVQAFVILECRGYPNTV